MKNYHFNYSITIDNELTKVWNFLADVERWHEWDTELQEAAIEGKFQEGSKGELRPKKGPKLTFVIRDVLPLHSYTLKTKMPIGHLVIKRSLTKKAGGIVFTDDIEFTGVLKHLFGLILGRGFKSVLPEVMEKFKQIAEKE